MILKLLFMAIVLEFNGVQTEVVITEYYHQESPQRLVVKTDWIFEGGFE